MYQTFDNTKTSEYDYSEDAPAPANSIAGQPYNVKGGGDNMRTKCQVRNRGAPVAYLSIRSTDAIFGMKVTFLTTSSLPQIASISPPTNSENLQKLYIYTPYMTCLALDRFYWHGLASPSRRRALY